MNQVQEDLTVMAAVVGIGEINSETASEFWARLSLLQHIGGSVSRRKPLTHADVHNNLGLQSDARTLPRDEWFTAVRVELLDPMLAAAKREYSRTYERRDFE